LFLFLHFKTYSTIHYQWYRRKKKEAWPALNSICVCDVYLVPFLFSHDVQFVLCCCLLHDNLSTYVIYIKWTGNLIQSKKKKMWARCPPSLSASAWSNLDHKQYGQKIAGILVNWQ
jgi:hypothetical protein